MGTNEDNYVRLGVFDSFGNLIGFKSDVFWVLGDESSSIVHPLEEFLNQHSQEVKSLIFFLNNSNWWRHNSRKISAGRFDDDGTLSIVAKDYETDLERVRYVFSRNKSGAYFLTSQRVGTC